MRRIVGIDPGSQRVGIGNIWMEGRTVVAASSTALDVSGLTLFQMIVAVRVGLQDVPHADLVTPLREPDVVAIEEPGKWLGSEKASRNLVALAKLYQVIGALLVTFQQSSPDVRLVTDTEVKRAATGKGSAPKYEVHRVLPMFGYTLGMLKKQTCADCRKAGYDDQHSPDAADALSIAHCVATG